MKRIPFTILSLLLVLISNAQITFQKTFNVTTTTFYEPSVKQTTDGGYIFAGTTGNFGVGGYDVYLLKTDANGNLLWTKTFGGTANDVGYSVEQTTDGGYIISGYTWSFGAGGEDVYLIKTDTNGTLQWSKTYGGIGNDVSFEVRQTTDGGYIVTGYCSSFPPGGTVYLIKTDANGNTLWTKIYGGSYDDRSYSVQQTTDGGYIVLGELSGPAAIWSNILLIKTDSIGNLVWTKTFGSTAGYNDGTSLEQTNDGGYILANVTTYGTGLRNLYLIKTDSSGNVIWKKTMGGANYDFGECVQQTNDGGYVITGSTTSFGAGGYDVSLIKTDSSGNVLWARTFGGVGSDAAYSVQQTNDGGYIVGGYSGSFVGGNPRVYLIKTDSLGNSGCNQGNMNLVIGNPTIQSANINFPVASPPTIAGVAASITGYGGVGTVLCISTGMSETEGENSLSIFPIPAHHHFTVAFEKTIISGHIAITDIQGKNIFYEHIFNETKKEINVENVAPGIYFVRVFDGFNFYNRKINIE